MVTAATKARANRPAAAKAETAEAAAQETDSQKRNRLRNEAERHILNKHKDEFDDYAENLFAKNGLTFNRRLSEAQKAEKKINDLIAAHPELEGMLRAKFVPTDADAPAEDESGVNPALLAEDYAQQVDYSADEANYQDPFTQQG